jgi:hypothetical protein
MDLGSAAWGQHGSVAGGTRLWTVEAAELLPELAEILDGGLIEDFDDDPA